MSNIIDLKKGLNIPISGVAALEAKKTIVPDTVAIKPTDFKGFSPRLLVKEGDKVLGRIPCFGRQTAPGHSPDLSGERNGSGNRQGREEETPRCAREG